MRKETAMGKDWLLPDSIAKITARDGTPHSIVSFTAAKTVLLVVDMQNYYVMEGQGAYSPAARMLVPNINRLADTMRRIGGSVIWARNYV
ncbi:MAG TPA: isochorismatase family protein, partial [Acetobacteraceae bacterium]|nr:isochorismatase family protein [Acetobacteraceae bacterium]